MTHKSYVKTRAQDLKQDILEKHPKPSASARDEILARTDKIKQDCKNLNKITSSQLSKVSNLKSIVSQHLGENKSILLDIPGAPPSISSEVESEILNLCLSISYKMTNFAEGAKGYDSSIQDIKIKKTFENLEYLMRGPENLTKLLSELKDYDRLNIINQYKELQDLNLTQNSYIQNIQDTILTRTGKIQSDANNVITIQKNWYDTSGLSRLWSSESPTEHTQIKSRISKESNLKDIISRQLEKNSQSTSDISGLSSKIESEILNLCLCISYKVTDFSMQEEEEEEDYKVSELDINNRFEKLEGLVSGSKNFTNLLHELKDEKNINIINQHIDLQAINFIQNSYFQNGLVLGRKDAYRNKEDGEQISIRNPETFEYEKHTVLNINTIRKTKTSSRLGAKTEGAQQEQSLLGKMYLPSQDSEHLTLHIAWRGSQTFESWLSNLQGNPGVESHFAHEDEILEQIIDAIESLEKKYDKPVNVMISGHSLGAALSQSTFNSLQRALCRGSGNFLTSAKYNQDITEEFRGNYSSHDVVKRQLREIDKHKINPKKVASMHVCIINPPGVPEAIANSSNECSHFLTHLKGEQHVSQNMHAIMTHGDLVQVGGQSTILCDLETNGAQAELLFNDTEARGLYSSTSTVVASGAAAYLSTLGLGLFVAVPAAITMIAMNGIGLANKAHAAHTKDFIDDEGLAKNQESALTTYHSSMTKDGTDTIRRHLLNKSQVLKLGASTTNMLDILGKREDLEKRLPQKETIEAASIEVKSNAASDSESDTESSDNTKVAHTDTDEDDVESLKQKGPK